jgi:2-haloacid dehalogenase
MAQRVGAQSVKAIAFDAFTFLDPRPVFALAEKLFPGKGGVLGEAWRTRSKQPRELDPQPARYPSSKLSREATRPFLTNTTNPISARLWATNRPPIEPRTFNQCWQ